MLYLKKITKGILQVLVISCITLLLLEVVYRYGVIDFYKAEIEALNPSDAIESDAVDYLVFGDSFSTPTGNYVDLLRDTYPEKSFLNLGIPGTGIKQVNTFAKKKIKKHNPKHIVYQVYVGNDLLDVRHVSNWRTMSLARNLYWKTTDYILSGVYINQKLKQFGSHQINIGKLEKNVFSKQLYTKRQRMLFEADAYYLDKTITLKDDFLDRYEVWKDGVQSFLEVIPSDVTVSIVFIPHCAQLNSEYYSHMLELGAQFENETNVNRTHYTFYTKAVSDFGSMENVTFYNPISYLKQKDTISHRLYYNNDPHFNNNGQLALYEFLDGVIFSK